MMVMAGVADPVVTNDAIDMNVAYVSGFKRWVST
jgi:hypothetical protein